MSLAWDQTADNGRFRCTVEQDANDGHQGTLRVVEVASGDEVLSQPTSIAYEAIFGPDVSDVYLWEQQCLEAIDQWLLAHGETPPEEKV